MNFNIFLIFFLKIMIIHSELEPNKFKLNYYKKLITEMDAEAKNNSLRKSNAEFQTGYESTKIEDYGEFDFIVVGAGSSGAVMATRLSEISDWKILLLEAGGEENDYTKIPTYALHLLPTEYNWGYLSTPQNNSCLGMKNRQCSAPRGKILGGTSAINTLLYVRGNEEDYNKWEKIGNAGWSYKDVLPYFKKSENSQINGDKGYHGKGGLFNVEYDQPLHPLVKRFFQANEKMKVFQLDYNGVTQIGCSQTQFNTKLGQRESTNAAFLTKSRSRINLNVTTKALVTQILIKKSQIRQAEGVVFVKNNKKFRAIAKKEVILSAGAINSPQLLMLSGIGPKKHLKSLGIDVVMDLPVGEKLIEHPMFHGLRFLTNFTGTNPSLKTNIEEYLQGFGPLTISTNLQAVAFTPAKNQSTNKKQPLFEYLFYPLHTSNEWYNRAFNFNDDIINKYLNKLDQLRTIQIVPVLLHPKSRGSLTLQSNNPIDFPLISFNMFSDEQDIINMIDGIHYVMDLVKTKPFQEINARFIDDLPICQDKKKFSDDYWECLIRFMATTIFHPCGTTKMGRKLDSDSVVDNNLKVHNVEKLRVVDAGVIPSTISGHTNAASIMIAEKISDVIKNYYKVTM